MTYARHVLLLSHMYLNVIGERSNRDTMGVAQIRAGGYIYNSDAVTEGSMNIGNLKALGCSSRA